MRCSSTGSKRGASVVGLLPNYLLDARSITKYHAVNAPKGAIQLGIAETQLMQEHNIKVLNGFCVNGAEIPSTAIYYQSTSGRDDVKESVGSFIQYITDVPQDLDIQNGLLLGAGCNAVLENLCTCLADRDEAVLIPTPYYAAFEFDLVARAGLHVQPVVTNDDSSVLTRTSSDDGDNSSSTNTPNGTIDPSVYYPTEQSLNAAYEQATLDGHTPKILLLSHPQNPLGVYYPNDVLKLCINWCRSRHVHLVADEIYAGSVYRDSSTASFTSILKLASTHTEQNQGPGLGLGDYIHWVYSISKDFGMSGLRVGCCYTENTAIQTPMSKLNDFCQIPSTTQLWLKNSLLQTKDPDTRIHDDRTTASALDAPWDYKQYMRLNHERLDARAKELTDVLNEFEIPYLYPTAGLFVWMNFSQFLDAETAKDERELYLKLVNTYGLLFTPGVSMQHSPGYFRCVFTAASAAEFAIAISRLKTFLESERK